MRERLAQLPSIPIFMQNIHQIIQWFFYLQAPPCSIAWRSRSFRWWCWVIFR